MTIEDLWMPEIPSTILMACRYRARWYRISGIDAIPYRDTITQGAAAQILCAANARMRV